MPITDGGLLTLPPLPSFIRPLYNDESRMLNERIPSAAAVHPERCLTCKGRKVFRWWDQSEMVAEYRCPCENQYILHRWLLHCGIMLNYQCLGWRDLIALDDKTAVAISKYFDKREAYLSAGIGMILNGPKGNGKTLLAMLLLKQMIGEGIDVYATTFSDMVDSFAGGWQDRAQSQWFNSTVRNAGVLYIDDLGRERNKGPNSVGENMLETVVRSRVANNQPTIITTNLSEQEIHAGYGGHTMSLLTEKSVVVTLSGSDLRDQIRQRALDEVDAGLTRPVVLA